MLGVVLTQLGSDEKMAGLAHDFKVRRIAQGRQGREADRGRIIDIRAVFRTDCAVGADICQDETPPFFHGEFPAYAVFRGRAAMQCHAGQGGDRRGMQPGAVRILFSEQDADAPFHGRAGLKHQGFRQFSPGGSGQVLLGPGGLRKQRQPKNRDTRKYGKILSAMSSHFVTLLVSGLTGWLFQPNTIFFMAK